MKRPSSACPSPSLLFILLLGALFCAYLGACCSYVLLLDRSTSSPAPASRALRAPPPTELEEEAAARAQLGRSSWELLHRLAAAFDKAPTPQRVKDGEQFFTLLSELYPCEECAGHFRKHLQTSPVDARDNKRLSLWLCKVHNEVNVRLGKPEFPCALESLADRWGKCGCFGNLTLADKLLK